MDFTIKACEPSLLFVVFHFFTVGKPLMWWIVFRLRYEGINSFLQQFIFTTGQWSCVKVVLSVVCVRLFTGPKQVPATSYHTKTPGPFSQPYRNLPNMFKFVQLGPYCTGPPFPPPNRFELVHHAACTFGKAGGWHSTEKSSCTIKAAASPVSTLLCFCKRKFISIRRHNITRIG